VIPQRIQLGGFLSYKEGQEVRFDGASLWMLSGLNGSGKSAVFDAMTYALFGHHRGGSQQSVELINKDAKGLSVEFDFRIDKQLYRLKRTLKRTPRGAATGTQQVYAWVSDPFGDGGDWQPVPDTNRKAEFDDWVRQKIGLNYDTFTSSVLLLQGKAEKLLDSKPSGRAEVLAGIVDLERYQRLHARADDRRRDLKARLESAQNQFEGVPEVSDFELAVAQQKIDEADEAHRIAVAEVERLRHLEYEAKRWSELQNRFAGLAERQKQAEALVGESAQIEKDYRRLRELQEVLPHILSIQEHERSVAGSLETAKRLQGEREATLQKKAALEHTLDLARQKRASLQKTIAADETKLKGVETRLRELAGLLEKVKQLERQESEIRKVETELARLPADPEQEVRRLQELHDHVVELARVLPVLDRFQQNRAELSAARQRLDKDEEKVAEVMKAGKQAGEEAKALREQVQAAAKIRAEADERATQARTLLEQANAALEELQSLRGEKTCRHCGQPLTAAHMQQEKERREKTVLDAQRHHDETVVVQQKSRHDEQTFVEAATKREQEHQALREQYRDVGRDVQEARSEAKRAEEECRRAYLSLPDVFRLKIAPDLLDDWLKTDYPTRADVSAARKEAAELATVGAQVRSAQNQLTTWAGLQAKLASAREIAARLSAELHGTNPDRLYEENASLRGEEESLTNALKGSKKSLQDTDTDLERHAEGLTRAGNELAEVDSKLRAEDVSLQHVRAAIRRSYEVLPESWRIQAEKAGLAEQLCWKQERDDLIGRNVETRYEQLTAARVGVDELKRELAAARQQEALFPEEARRSPELVASLREQARRRAAECEPALRDAQKQMGILDQNRRQRELLRQETLDLEREHNYATLLAQLLGRDRLQRHLVRVAERQIVDYANGVLDRLSGGQIFLRLCGGDDGAAADHALELEACNRTTGGDAINIAFLSGSQRFRVAVSLALGIGQYASRQHRPIESVIIDEGFGCLDRHGRQVMIQELQNLRGHLQCILLVSHQEEFADAFPDGYRFELEDGATKVMRHSVR
jgi:DNA repair protein SbcC/Rad50